jgi:putative hydrolase of the HAD superfamily
VSDFEPSEVELRRAARERAMELLYESEAKGTDVDAVLDALPLPPDPLALELVRGVALHRAEIDELLAARVAPRWSLTRLAAVDRAILRLATYELIGAHDRSQALIINEALVLARRFGTDDSPRFVNGVLSAVAAEVRPEAGDDRDADTRGEAAGNPAGPEGDGEGNGRRRLVDAVIIDLDGVIRHWDDEAMPALERELGLPAGTITGAAFDPVRLDRAMRGVLTAEEWYAEIGAAVAEAHGVDAEAVATAFSEVGWRIDESVVDLVAEVRRLAQVPVVLLSNASTRLLDDLLVSGIASSFDAIVSSADIGSSKPDAKAFTAAVEAAGAEPERCLFVDDTPENIAGARALGLRVLQFEDVETLDEELQALGLLPDHSS